MSKIIELLDKIANEIKCEFGEDAVVEFAPELELKDVQFRRVVIVPSSLESEIADRRGAVPRIGVDIGIMQKIRESSTVNDLIDLMERLTLHFSGWEGAEMVCIESTTSPLYESEYLRKRRQFFGVLHLEFQE